jgi:predicted RNase H-like HicB family nuclease
METIRIIYHQDEGGWWAESPDLERWSAAGETYTEVVKLAEEGVVFVLGREVEIEHFVPAGEHAPA